MVKDAKLVQKGVDQMRRHELLFSNSYYFFIRLLLGGMFLDRDGHVSRSL